MNVYQIATHAGSPRQPMLPNAEMPAADIHNLYGIVYCTTSGVVCGSCSDSYRETVRHASAAHVRKCHDIRAERDAEYRAEMAAGA